VADEMVSADFVDDLVAAEEGAVWTEEQAEQATASRSDEQPTRGRRRRRRRGGRRTRDDSGPVRGEPARAESVRGDEFDDDEDSLESQHIDEIVDAIEASPIAEADERGPLEEAVAAEGLHDRDDERHRGKRRRRRRGRRRDAESGSEPTEREEVRDEADTDLDEEDDLATPGTQEIDGEFEAEDDDEDEDQGDGNELRPSHRGIPSWEEAVGMIVSANMEARAKNPHAGGPRGRGRGQHGRGRRP
jgi:ribonuclease E